MAGYLADMPTFQLTSTDPEEEQMSRAILRANQNSLNSSSRPLLIDRLNSEGLEGSQVKVRQSVPTAGGTERRRQRHSAPDIFFGRNSEIEELRRRHEQEVKHRTDGRRRSSERRASLPVVELEQITEEEEEKSELEVGSPLGPGESAASLNNNRLPPIYESQKLNTAVPEITVNDQNISAEYYCASGARRRKFSV